MVESAHEERDRRLGKAIRLVIRGHEHEQYAPSVHAHQDLATSAQFQELREVVLDLVMRVGDLERDIRSD